MTFSEFGGDFLYLYYLFALFAAVLLLNCTAEKSAAPEQVNKRVAALIRVRPEFEERYIILHKHTFAGVLAQIHKANIRNYSIFLRDGMLFSYLEYVGENYEKDMAGIGEDQTTREWWKLTDPMQEPLSTRKDGEWWAGMEEIYFEQSAAKPQNNAARAAYVVQVPPQNLTAYQDLFQTVPADMRDILKEYHLQKIAVYYKDGRAYYYFEGAGPDSNSLNKFFADSRVQEFLQQTKSLEEKGSADGEEWLAGMKEVFHTD